jgi:protein-S-isoprenylcysteine O-methyltransferase Ste14
MLRSFYVVPFAALWLGWFAYWLVAARNVKATRRREPITTFLLNRVFVIIGVLLLLVPHLPPHWLEESFVAPGLVPYAVGIVVTVAGLAFSVWARVYLGRNWSATVTIKQDHELVRSGPYALVRHPIYSGILLALLGTAVAIGEWRGLLALAAITIGFVIKMQAEERFMDENFGEQYARYQREVAALIPFIL